MREEHVRNVFVRLRSAGDVRSPSHQIVSAGETDGSARVFVKHRLIDQQPAMMSLVRATNRAYRCASPVIPVAEDGVFRRLGGEQPEKLVQHAEVAASVDRIAGENDQVGCEARHRGRDVDLELVNAWKVEVAQLHHA